MSTAVSVGLRHDAREGNQLIIVHPPPIWWRVGGDLTAGTSPGACLPQPQGGKAQSEAPPGLGL